MLLYSNVDINWQEKTKFYEIKDFKIQRAVNSIISNAWPNQTYSHILSYWLTGCGYEISASRRAVSLSALASFQYTTTTNYTNDRAL